MLLGEKGRIIKELRLRAQQILIENIQRPVALYLEVKIRKNNIGNANKFDSYEEVVQPVKRKGSKRVDLKLVDNKE